MFKYSNRKIWRKPYFIGTQNSQDANTQEKIKIVVGASQTKKQIKSKKNRQDGLYNTRIKRKDS